MLSLRTTQFTEIAKQYEDTEEGMSQAVADLEALLVTSSPSTKSWIQRDKLDLEQGIVTEDVTTRFSGVFIDPNLEE